MNAPYIGYSISAIKSYSGLARQSDNAHAEHTDKKALPHDNAFSQHKNNLYNNTRMIAIPNVPQKLPKSKYGQAQL
ncbi:hypothetical protein [uncultured Prevotella sp.]|uniref:hypothetical protein n=1 Tax=uncultured Prevotella sp. TaxID=159272 RepID=UPI00266CF654|nr:hypothetical protein [uncultured Prevotella sp.]